MEKNVGGMDRIARLILGPVLIGGGIAGYAGLLGLAVGPLPQALTSVLVVLVGVVLLVTGAVQRCPLNRLLGLNTHPQETTGKTQNETVTNRK